MLYFPDPVTRTITGEDITILKQGSTYLTLNAHAQRGLRYLVCVFVCLSTSILALQGTKRHKNDTNRYSATFARIINFAKMMPFEIVKLALSLTTLRDPTHQIVVSMRVLYKLDRAAPPPFPIVFSASSRGVVPRTETARAAAPPPHARKQIAMPSILSMRIPTKIHVSTKLQVVFRGEIFLSESEIET